MYSFMYSWTWHVATSPSFTSSIQLYTSRYTSIRLPTPYFFFLHPPLHANLPLSSPHFTPCYTTSLYTPLHPFAPLHAPSTPLFTLHITLRLSIRLRWQFNRGLLLNIGYELAKKQGFNVFIFHDVDLLPQPKLLSWNAHLYVHLLVYWFIGSLVYWSNTLHLFDLLGLLGLLGGYYTHSSSSFFHLSTDTHTYIVVYVCSFDKPILFYIHK